MKYLPSLENVSKQTIITVVSLIAAGLVISYFQSLQKILNQSNKG